MDQIDPYNVPELFRGVPRPKISPTNTTTYIKLTLPEMEKRMFLKSAHSKTIDSIGSVDCTDSTNYSIDSIDFEDSIDSIDANSCHTKDRRQHSHHTQREKQNYYHGGLAPRGTEKSYA